MNVDPLGDLDTPCLLLDQAQLETNAAMMLDVAARKGVRLRPHVKTSKCLEVAEIATGGRREGLTVSTLAEAEFFARGGFRDILYAVGVSANKFSRIANMIRDHDADLVLVTDSIDVAEAAAEFTETTGTRFRIAIEIDCGEHRGGIPPDDPMVLRLAQCLDQAPGISFAGVMTHAGQSYWYNDNAEHRRVAREEVAAVTGPAEQIRALGIAVDMVSIGSTPTVLFGEDFSGVTEVRAGVYVFFDVSQIARNACTRDDLAVSVLSTVIGHNRAGLSVLLDAGGLALSKDLGAPVFMSDAGYGQVCDAETLRQYGALIVEAVHQEHGTVPVPDEGWFQRLPIGSLVRILPNHVCMTAAAHDRYVVLDKTGTPSAEWERTRGW